MLGYLVVGVLIGPNALALAKDTAGVKYLAEFGVVFLMFVIGLEFNLPKLRSMRTLVFGLGLSQVVLTIDRRGGRALPAGGWILFVHQRNRGSLAWQGAVVLGGAIAMSSTAIVVKLMAERLEARQRTRQARDGHPAVPGPGRRAAAGGDPGARGRRASDLAMAR